MDAAAVLASARIDIEAGNAAWLRGMKQRDAAAVADAYADSGVFVGPDGQCVRGREAIMKMYELRVAKIATVLGGGVTSEATHVVGDRVYEWGHAWLELAGPRPADPAIKRGGPYLTVWQRDATAAGHWRIIRNLAL